MKTIAMVGLSEKPERPSYEVGVYLKNQGYDIIPINPTIKEWRGIRAYGSIKEIPHSIKIDIVDIFRKPTEVVAILKEVVESGRKPLIWLQEGVGSIEALEFAKENNLEITMDHCLMKAHLAGEKI